MIQLRFLGLTTGRTNQNFLSARNSLTQRSFGPESSGVIAVDISGMKDGGVAGLGALQKNYSYVGVKITGSTKTLVMVDGTSGSAKEIATAAVSQTKLYFITA